MDALLKHMLNHTTDQHQYFPKSHKVLSIWRSNTVAKGYVRFKTTTDLTGNFKILTKGYDGDGDGDVDYALARSHLIYQVMGILLPF